MSELVFAWIDICMHVQGVVSVCVSVCMVHPDYFQTRKQREDHQKNTPESLIKKDSFDTSQS